MECIRALVTSALAAYLFGCTATANEPYRLLLEPLSEPLLVQRAEAHAPDKLPHSTVSTGRTDIRRAWLAGATKRYPHGVLGDRLEASRLEVLTSDSRYLSFALPKHRVFEDLAVRLHDLDSVAGDEMIVVESDATLGASLAVFGLASKAIALRARTPFIGTPQRWLNPVGAGDFDGDGTPELALVRTPHLGGVLEIYEYTEPELTLVASKSGFSTHALGSTELGLGQVVTREGGDLILLPKQRHRTLSLVSLRDSSLHVVAEVDLPDRITSTLRARAPGVFAFEIADGRVFSVKTLLPPLD